MPRWILLTCVACVPVEADVAQDRAPWDALELSPRILGQGTEASVLLGTDEVDLTAGGITLDLGEGLSVDELVVLDATSARAVVSVDEDAPLGPRDAQLTAGDGRASRSDALLVIAESFEVRPDSAQPGEVLEVGLTGRATAWDGLTWPTFGAGTEVLALEHLGPEDALVTLAIDDDAAPGPREVIMDGVSLWDGFTVGAAPGMAASLNIDTLPQGATVDVILTGRGTRWQSTAPGLVFHDGGGPNADLRVVELEVVSDTEAKLRLQASNAARLGSRDVLVTDRDDGTDGLWIADALEVVATPPRIDEVVTQISWTGTRTVDPSGRIEEDADAWVAFVVPLDPPCGWPAPPEWGAPPFDNPIVRVLPPRVPPEDCPHPLTVEAGDRVWLSSDEHGTIPLTREVLPSTGQVIYRREWSDLSDYPYGASFDLVVSGDGALPAFQVDDVLHTVPAPVRLLQPSGRSLDRDEDAVVLWSPARTYPIDQLELSILATSREDPSREALLSVIPWDDGRYAVPSELLRTLGAGPALLELASEAQTETFALGFSELTQPEPTVRMTARQTVFLE